MTALNERAFIAVCLKGQPIGEIFFFFEGRLKRYIRTYINYNLII